MTAGFALDALLAGSANLRIDLFQGQPIRAGLGSATLCLPQRGAEAGASIRCSADGS